MDMTPKQTEHTDLEERITISAEVDLGSGTAEFEGLKELDIVIKKKVIKNDKIQNIELRKRNDDRSLF